MLDINKAIRTERSYYKNDKYGKIVYIFNCINCGNEMKKSKYDCTIATGLCKNCNKGSSKDPENSKYKKCRICSLTLPISNFTKRYNKHYRNECKKCVSIRVNFKNFNYKLFLDLYKKQEGKCAICNEIETSKLSNKLNIPRSLAIDHCHKTNRIRGLLCSKCNKGIGLLKEDINIMNNAIKYLEKYNFEEVEDLSSTERGDGGFGSSGN